MFKPRLRVPRVSLPRPRAALRRSLHSVPTPEYSGVNGIPGLLSADGFNLAWNEYMTFAVEKLNQLTAGTQYAEQETRQIITATAREPSQAPIFNYASMAHNNHFFFKNLRTESEDPVPIPIKLRKALEAQFSSIETLRLEMLLTANAMFGPGFVWLVKNAKSEQYRILTTYLAGSPYSDAHWRRQGVDTNTMAGPSSSEGYTVAHDLLGRSQLGAGADNGAKWSKEVAPGGITVIPLLCVNTWEHVWLMDYGVGTGGRGGKRLYLENWWNAVDWNKVAGNALLDSKVRTVLMT